MLKLKHSLLTDVDKHSLVSIEHWSPNNYLQVIYLGGLIDHFGIVIIFLNLLQILKSDLQSEEAFNQKWLNL